MSVSFASTVNILFLGFNFCCVHKTYSYLSVNSSFMPLLHTCSAFSLIVSSSSSGKMPCSIWWAIVYMSSSSAAGDEVSWVNVLWKYVLDMRICPFLLMWAPHVFWHASHEHRLYVKYWVRVFSSGSSWGVESRTAKVESYIASNTSSSLRAMCDVLLNSLYRASVSSSMLCFLV